MDGMGPCPGDDRVFAITVVWQVRILRGRFPRSGGVVRAHSNLAHNTQGEKAWRV
jgi:hypothetical protein